MLKKLLKYDLQWMLKVIVIYLTIGVALGVIGKLIEFLPDSLIFNIIEGICKGAAVSLLITGLVNAVIRSWVRLIHNLYKDEGYITNTLPIKTELHLISKVISTLIIIIGSSIILFLMLALMYLNKDSIEFLIESMKIYASLADISVVGLLILVVLLLLVEILFIVLIGFFGIVWGYSFNTGKLGKSFLFALIIYGAVQIINVILIVGVALLNPNLYDILFNQVEVMDYELLKGLLIGYTIFYVIVCGITFYLTYRKIKKGINID